MICPRMTVLLFAVGRAYSNKHGFKLLKLFSYIDFSKKKKKDQKKSTKKWCNDRIMRKCHSSLQNNTGYGLCKNKNYKNDEGLLLNMGFGH